jgi:8-oxo-dGTP pyrophosphatase MutT (NUDIX family)
MSTSKILSNVRLIQKCIVVGPDGKILALKRAPDDHSRSGNWDLPGGGYEQGELVLVAAAREVMEEVGLSVHTLIPVYFTNQLGVKEGFFQGENVLGICYFTREWVGEVVLSDEHIEYQWVTPKELLTYNFGKDGGFFSASIQAYLASVR